MTTQKILLMVYIVVIMAATTAMMFTGKEAVSPWQKDKYYEQGR
jgi:hypothetical protein